MAYWTFASNFKRRYDSDRIILARFDYKAYFFEVDSRFLSLFHLFEQGITTEEMEKFINEQEETEKGTFLAVIRDLEQHHFLIERDDPHV